MDFFKSRNIVLSNLIYQNFILIFIVLLSCVIGGCSSSANVEVVNDISDGSGLIVGIDGVNTDTDPVKKGTPKTIEVKWSGNDAFNTRIWGLFTPVASQIFEQVIIEDGGDYIWRINENGIPEQFRRK